MVHVNTPASEESQQRDHGSKAIGQDRGTSKPHDKAAVLEIKTLPDGYNSGRTYYLSTHSQHTLDELIQCLSHKAQAARAQAETRTAFQRLQLRVRRRYESPLFQGLMAVLIAAVRRRASDARLLTLHGKQTSIAPASIVP